MATRRRHRRPHPSDGVAVDSNPHLGISLKTESSGAAIGLSRWLIAGCVGMFLGAVTCAVIAPLLAFRGGQNSTDDGLLVTQQLDALFGVVETQLKEDPGHLAAYEKLLDTFLRYDRLYVEQPGTESATQLAKAYAARRMGHVCQAGGSLEDSCRYYRQSRDLFASCMRADPNVTDLFALWLNAHTQIIYVEMACGKGRSAETEYVAALRGLQESTLVQDFDYHKSMMLELKSLAQLGIEIKLYEEAAQVAKRFADSARVLADRSPSDSELAQDVADAELYLQVLSSLLHPKEKQ